jgi:hypothetical protein
MNLQIFSHFAATTSCSSNFLGFPTWYKYLKLTAYPDCSPQFTSISDVWLIVAAIVELLLRVAALAAIVMVMYGAVEYIISQGEPDRTSRARSTIINALIGLAVAVVAAALVTFIAGQFTAS